MSPSSFAFCILYLRSCLYPSSKVPSQASMVPLRPRRPRSYRGACPIVQIFQQSRHIHEVRGPAPDMRDRSVFTAITQKILRQSSCLAGVCNFLIGRPIFFNTPFNHWQSLRLIMASRAALTRSRLSPSSSHLSHTENVFAPIPSSSAICQRGTPYRFAFSLISRFFIDLLLSLLQILSICGIF